MATLSSLIAAIQDILDDSAYTDEKIITQINGVVSRIAGGVRIPDGQISPPLPDLYTYGTVDTSITIPYVSLPADYQRGVSLIYDSSNYKIEPPRGGNYYAFSRFLTQASNKALAETGSVYQVAVKGSKLYYQGIPSASTTLGIHYYKTPTDMALDGDVPDGLPDHLAEDLIKHSVLMSIYGNKIEAGVTEPARGMQYHEKKFYEAMIDLADYIGLDGEPQYYGGDGYEDAGSCD